MRVSVDGSRCIGCGMCQAAVPGVFRVVEKVSTVCAQPEKAQEGRYEDALDNYERTAVRANVWQSALPPLYLAVSNLSVIFILYFGGNVLVSFQEFPFLPSIMPSPFFSSFGIFLSFFYYFFISFV